MLLLSVGEYSVRTPEQRQLLQEALQTLMVSLETQL